MINFKTYYYGSGGVMDHGWGCSYRNAQTVAAAMGKAVPSMKDLLGVFDLQKVAPGRKRWIEPLQVGVLLRKLCDIHSTHVVYARNSLKDFEIRRMLRSKVRNYRPNDRIEADGARFVARLERHFRESGGLPAVIDDGFYSYVLLPHSDDGAFTLVDPHVPPRSTRADHIRRITAGELRRTMGWMVLLPLKHGGGITIS